MVKVGEEELYFDRDNDGKLVPQKFEIEVDGIKEDVMLTPLTRGELKVLFAFVDDDFEKYMLLNNVLKPRFTEKDLEIMKYNYIDTIVNKIYSISGIRTKKKKDRKIEFEKEDEFGKHLRMLRERKQEGDMILFLHELGYNFLTVNKLTTYEINWLIQAWNGREQKRKVESKGFKT